jgi:hypothetical protein
MKLSTVAANLAGMDYLALLQALFGIGYVISHALRGDTSADVWLTGYSMAFGGISTKLAYETVNPKLRRPVEPPRANLLDRITRGPGQ